MSEHDAVVGATTFLSFPKLPAELRLKIWHDAAHLPRTVTVGSAYDDTAIGDALRLWRHLKHNVHTVPAVMHACHASREVALKYYKSFSHRLFNGKGFFINYAVDTLLLWDWWTVQAMYPHFRTAHIIPENVELEKNVKIIALAGHYPRRAYVYWLNVLKLFTRVEEVVLEDLSPEFDDHFLRGVRAFHSLTLQKHWDKKAAGGKTPIFRLVDKEVMVAMRAEQEVS